MPPTSTNNFFGIKVSKAGIPVNQASDKQLIYKDDFSTKTYYDNTNARMIEGKLPDGSYGLWVSKPGTDVSDVNAPADGGLIFNSNQDILKIVTSGQVSQTVPNIANTVSVGSYIQTVSFVTTNNKPPAVIAYFSFSNGNSLTLGGIPIVTGNPQALPYTAAVAAAPIISVFFDITSSILTFYFNQLTEETYNLPPIITYTYFILQETVST